MSSPDSRPPVRVTYLGRAKSRRTKNASTATDQSESEEEDIMSVEEKSPAKAKSTARPKNPAPPASPGKVPKKVDVHLPGPSPRTAAKADGSPAPSKPKSKSQHVRAASSVSSISRFRDDATASPASAQKPLSAIKRKRFTTPETVDDNASVAESSFSTAVIRRTEAERIEYFKNQPDCADTEPHSVLCTRCNKTVNLGRKQTYAVKPWEKHRVRCDAKVSASVADDAMSLQSDMRSEAGTKTRTTQAERKKILEEDERAEDVQIDQVLCRKCQKWVRLSTRTPYALGNWNQHQNGCADVAVSSRVAMAQRKIRLVNDAQAKTSGPRHVECRECGTSVALAGEWDYTLTSWEQHKETCPPPGAPSTRKAAKARSSVSTDATVVAPEPEPEASTSRGTKRRLEDPELPADDPDVRAPNRPRTETYEPVQKEPPSLLGWFLLPFKAFMHGFKEGISEAPPS